MQISLDVYGDKREVKFFIADTFLVDEKFDSDVPGHDVVEAALKDTLHSRISSDDADINAMISHLIKLQEILSLELGEIADEVIVGPSENIIVGGEYALWINGELWSNCMDDSAVEDAMRAYHRGKMNALNARFSGNEDKRQILNSLAGTLKLTRAGCDISDIGYEKEPHGDEYAVIRFNNGYRKPVLISGSSGASLIRDVLRKIA